MNKSKILLFATVLFMLFIAGCGSQKTVPDKMLEWEVEEYLKSNKYLGGAYTNYDYSVVHSPDKSTNTDTVQINLSITYPHNVTSSIFSATYQYDRSSDLWSVLRGGNWDAPNVLSYDITESARIWQQSFESAGWTVTLEGEGADYIRQQIDYRKDASGVSFDYPTQLVDKLEDFWYLSAFKQYYEAGGSQSFAEIAFFKFPQVEDAETLFSFYNSNWDTSNYTIEKTGSGEDYSLIVYADYYFGAGEKMVLVRIDNTLFSIGCGMEDLGNSETDLNSIFESLGYTGFKLRD